MITIDQLDQAHARVALDILEADGGVTVFEGSVPDGSSPPYVLVYAWVEWSDAVDGKTFDGKTGTCVTYWNIHAVGETDASARIVGNRVRQLLVNVQPTIAGRSCGRIQQYAVVPVVRNEETGTPVFDATTEYTLTTFSST